jgi:hypothetical protein
VKYIVFTAGGDESNFIGDKNGEPFDNPHDAAMVARKYEDDEVYAYAVPILKDDR